MSAGCGRSSDSQAKALGTLLLTRLPISHERQCLDWAFVPAYRCGAVLELHQVPSFNAFAYRQQL